MYILMKFKTITRQNRGIALIEVMVAVGILTLTITAITSAIVAGQQQSLAARERIIASVATESLLATISNEPWESLSSWNDYREEVGSIVDPSGMSLEGDWDLIGREVQVADAEVFIEPLEIFIRGQIITVRSFNNDGNTISTLERFVPEPQS